MKKQDEFRKFDAEVIGMPPLSMALVDIPEPDPGKKNFRKNPADSQVVFEDTDIVTRLINYLKNRQ